MLSKNLVLLQYPYKLHYGTSEQGPNGPKVEKPMGYWSSKDAMSWAKSSMWS